MSINFVRSGAGAPLVLLHGIGHRWQAWEPIRDRLAAHHDVLALDLPGFGASPVPPGGMPRNMAGMVAALAEFFDGLGLSMPHVAGNSLGGAIALELGSAGLAASVTAFSPIGFFNDVERRRSLRIIGALRAMTFQPRPLVRAMVATPAIRNLIFGQIMAHPERLTTEQAWGATVALRQAAGFRPTVAWIREYLFLNRPMVTVTVGWGERDRILPPHEADRARALLPYARHIPLPDCGHVPMGDDPELTARLILETTGVVAGSEPVQPNASLDPGAPFASM